MSAKTDPPSSSGSGEPPDALPSASSKPTASAEHGAHVPALANQPPRRKPRISLFIATACGLGYLPKAPGTWGSLAGLGLAFVPFWGFWAVLLGFSVVTGVNTIFWKRGLDPLLWTQVGLACIVGAVGVLSANSAANFWGAKDPQRVVIDEVSGQHLTLLLGCALPIGRTSLMFPANFGIGLVTTHTALNWKYLLLGFILFRLFDISKPFPARQAESLPGGWGIMADDWIAGIYAGLGLWLLRALGL